MAAAAGSSISFISDAIDALDHVPPGTSPLIIADYGSYDGTISIDIMKKAIDSLKESKKIDNQQSVIVVHNDLPSNDWTSLFDRLNKDRSYFGVANGRSFYDSCLPPNSLSFGHSSNSIHYLSRTPCHLSNHCVSIFAQGAERRAYQEQAHLDLAQFLEHRSRELHVGGVFILTIFSVDENGVTGNEESHNLLYQCAQELFTQDELLHYSIPVYYRSLNECVDHDLFSRCSLTLIKEVSIKTQQPFYDRYCRGEMSLDEFARIRTDIFRRWTDGFLRQSLITNGRSEEEIEMIVNRFWILYEQRVKDKPDDHDMTSFRTYLILKKTQ